MNQFFSNNPVFANALKLRVRTSGPISGSTGYVRLPYGESVLMSTQYNKNIDNNQVHGARLMT